jgi:hypothetical protein
VTDEDNVAAAATRGCRRSAGGKEATRDNAAAAQLAVTPLKLSPVLCDDVAGDIKHGSCEIAAVRLAPEQHKMRCNTDRVTNCVTPSSEKPNERAKEAAAAAALLSSRAEYSSGWPHPIVTTATDIGNT